MTNQIDNVYEIDLANFQLGLLLAGNLTPKSILEIYETSLNLYSSKADIDAIYSGTKELYTSDRDTLARNVKLFTWQILYMTLNKPTDELPQTLAPLLLSSFVDYNYCTRLEEIDNRYLEEVLGVDWYINNESIKDVIEEGWLIVDGVKYILSFPDAVIGDYSWTVIS